MKKKNCGHLKAPETPKPETPKPQTPQTPNHFSGWCNLNPAAESFKAFPGNLDVDSENFGVHPFFNPTDKYEEQAGAELCQAQVKLS